MLRALGPDAGLDLFRNTAVEDRALDSLLCEFAGAGCCVAHSAEDLDQLIAAHKLYVDRILERALLTEAYEPARRQVYYASMRYLLKCS